MHRAFSRSEYVSMPVQSDGAPVGIYEFHIWGPAAITFRAYLKGITRQKQLLTKCKFSTRMRCYVCRFPTLRNALRARGKVLGGALVEYRGEKKSKSVFKKENWTWVDLKKEQQGGSLPDTSAFQPPNRPSKA